MRFATPKAFVFLRTLEQMKAYGLHYHFHEKSVLEYSTVWIQNVTLEMQNTKQMNTPVNEDSNCAGFSDSMLLETSVLYSKIPLY